MCVLCCVLHLLRAAVGVLSVIVLFSFASFGDCSFRERVFVGCPTAT